MRLQHITTTSRTRVSTSPVRSSRRRVTYVDDSPKEPVTLDVRFSTLDNNAIYTARTYLDAKEKNLRVSVENSGYRKVQP